MINMKQKNVAYFDFLNIAACLCVIGMHCNGIVHQFQNVPAWYVSMGVETLGYWAVPGFCMLSGATMMNYRERYSTKQFLKRRLMKIGIPLLVWTAVFYGYKLYTGALRWTGGRAFLNMLMNFSVENVYWFFGPLIMIYLSLPVLSKFANDKSMLRYMILLAVATTSVMPLLCNILDLSYNGNFYFPLLGGYLMYPVIGYYLHITELKTWQKIIIYVLGVLAAAARYWHTAWTFQLQGWADKMTWGYMNLPALLLAVAVFVLAKDICRCGFFQKEKVRKGMRWLAGASFGIYLIHIFVRNNLMELLRADANSYIWLLGGAILTYAVSLAIVQLLKKIPGGKYIFP